MMDGTVRGSWAGHDREPLVDSFKTYLSLFPQKNTYSDTSVQIKKLWEP